MNFVCINISGYDLTSPNMRDTLGLKTGEWTEVDTFSSKEIMISSTNIMTTKGCVSSQSEPVTSVAKTTFYCKGNYIDGLKDGIWKYYKGENKQYKQVTYKYGFIQKVEVNHNNGKLKLKAEVNVNTKIVHFITYDKSGKIESEGDFPVLLLYSNSMSLY